MMEAGQDYGWGFAEALAESFFDYYGSFDEELE
jgi:hypothetical protein